MGDPYNKMELASFMSCSKGYMGECGIRGGYAEVINMCPNVKAMYLKALSAMLCPTTVGQAVIECVCNIPKKGDPSYNLFIKEKTDVLDSLKVCFSINFLKFLPTYFYKYLVQMFRFFPVESKNGCRYIQYV